MNPNVNFTVRVQAQNGMFLGPDSFNGAIVTIKDQMTGRTLTSGLMNTGDSGTRSTSSVPGASPYTIVTPGAAGPTTYWVVPDSTTVCFSGSLYLPTATTLEIDVAQPLGPQGPYVYSGAGVNAVPGQDLPNIVVAVPGLWVQPELYRLDNYLRLRAKVTMLCGCMINPGTPWLPADFVVTATVTALGAGQSLPGIPTMTFQTNSQFFTDVQLPTSGRYEVRIDARQISSGLTGTATAVVV